MTHDRDFFIPEQVDEQVDQLSQYAWGNTPHPAGAGEPAQARTSLVGDLKAYYQLEQQEDSASLERAWKHISARLPRGQEPSQPTTPPLPLARQRASDERIRRMRNQVPNVSRGGNFSRRLSLLAAVLIAALLVGGLAIVLNLSRHPSATGGPGIKVKHSPTAVATITPNLQPPPIIGKTLYTTPANQWGFESLSWSPDSKRVASATIASDGVQFWDATTGDHLVTLQLPGGQNESAYGLDWSPNSEEVAVATNMQLLIVDGKTGQIIKSHTANVPAASSLISSGTGALSSLLPAAGGYGYRATSWSPDGKLLASAISVGPYGVVEVWNPQTGATVFTLSVGNSYNVGALAWSSDGQYLAATTWNTQSTDPTQPNSKVLAWSVSTHQVVFHHSDFMDSDAPVAWQPQSHNLAFGGATGGNLVATLEIWNATTGKLVKQYTGAGTGRLSWSPDGKYLAYADFGGNGAPNPVNIIDAATGKQIYSYDGHLQHISVIAWSPNGQYIASGEGNSQGKMVAKVWLA